MVPTPIPTHIHINFPGYPHRSLTIPVSTPELYQHCRKAVEKSLKSDNFRLIFQTLMGDQQHRIICKSDTDFRELLAFCERTYFPLTVEEEWHEESRDATAQTVGEVQEVGTSVVVIWGQETGVTSLETTATQIINAMNLMLPKGNEDAVLRIIVERLSDRLDVEPKRNGAQYSGSSSSDEIPLPHRLLGNPREMTNGYYDRDTSPPHGRMSEALRAVGVHPRIRLLDPPKQSRSSGRSATRYMPYPREPSEDSEPPVPPRRLPPPPATAPKPQRKRGGYQQQKQRGVTVAETSNVQFRRPTMAKRSVKLEGNVEEPITLRDLANKIAGYKCPRCPQSKKLKKDVVSHILCHGAVGKFSCHECDFAADSKLLFNWHIKAHFKTSRDPTPEPTGPRHWNGRPNPATLRNPSAADDLFSNPGSPAQPSAPGVPCVISTCRFVGGDCKALAEHMKREHVLFRDAPDIGSPRKPSVKRARTSHAQRARTTLGPSMTRMTTGAPMGRPAAAAPLSRPTVSVPMARMPADEPTAFQCPDCPDNFLFKTHLVLHRRHKHPTRQRKGRGVRVHNGPVAESGDVPVNEEDSPIAAGPAAPVKRSKRRVPKFSSRRKRRAAAKKAVVTRCGRRSLAQSDSEFPGNGMEGINGMLSAPVPRASVIVSVPEYVDQMSSSSASVGNPQPMPPKVRGRKRKAPIAPEVDVDLPPPLEMDSIEQNGQLWHEGPVEEAYDESAPGFEVSV